MAMMRTGRTAAFALLAYGVLGCSDSTGPSLSDLQPVGGTEFRAVVGRVVQDSLTVRAVRTDGSGAANVEVRFTVTGGGGSISPQTVRTDADGFAQAAWTIGTAVGDNTAQASVAGQDPVEFRATGDADVLFSITVTPNDVDFFAFGDVAQLTAAGADQYGNPVPTPNLAWRSADQGVASVGSGTGVVRAEALGSTQVIATSRGVEGAATVEVRQEPARLAIAPGEATINAIGFVRQLSATVWDANDFLIADPDVDWTTDAPAVATVDDNGVVTAHGVGTARITATSRSVTISITVTVRQIAASVTITPDTTVLLEGAAQQLAAQAFDSAGAVIPNADFVWSTRDTTIATVSATGSVVARRLGETDVVASFQGVSDQGAVLVQQVPSIAASGGHSCGVSGNGRIYCWGLNTHGQLGDLTTINRSTPVRVDGTFRYRSVALGHRHSCAIGIDGALRCWGSNEGGQLGTGNYTNRSSPGLVLGLSGVSQVSSGQSHTCAVESDGDVHCWGFNAQGQLGTGTRNDAPSPVRVLNLPLASSVGTGLYHTCALSNAGEVSCWGENLFGQLGNGTTDDSNTPVSVTLPAPAQALVVGAVHACALTVAGEAYCWGDNEYGQLGDGTSGNSRPTPVRAAAGRTFASLSSRGWYTCGREASGSVYCWGDNIDGQLSAGVTDAISTEPLLVSGGGVSMVAAGYFHTCAMRGDNAFCGGWNEYGQLGDGTTTDRSTLVAVQGWDPTALVSASLRASGSSDAGALARKLDARLRGYAEVRAQR